MYELGLRCIDQVREAADLYSATFQFILPRHFPLPPFLFFWCRTNTAVNMQDKLQYLHGDPKIIFFTDFDGTITLQDCKMAFL